MTDKVRNVGEKAKMGAGLAKAVMEVVARTEGQISVALSGGSLPAVLQEGLSQVEGMAWERWVVFFADERMVPHDHKDSNYKACKEALFDKVPIPESQIHKVDTSLPHAEAARAYEQLIKQHAPNGLTLLLLGMGPDGHTCSLFPNHALLTTDDCLVASITDSPKPPPTRVTLTLPCIKQASSVVFVCAGAEKADPIRRVIHPGSEPASDTPARIVHEASKDVTWVVDAAAASKL